MGGRITIPNIEKEMQEILTEGWMCRDDLKKLVLLGEAMDLLGHTDREFTEADAREWVSHMDPPGLRPLRPHRHHLRRCDIYSGYAFRRTNSICHIPVFADHSGKKLCLLRNQEAFFYLLTMSLQYLPTFMSSASGSEINA